MLTMEVGGEGVMPRGDGNRFIGQGTALSRGCERFGLLAQFRRRATCLRCRGALQKGVQRNQYGRRSIEFVECVFGLSSHMWHI